VRPKKFEVAELFSALRGMLRPLLVTETVRLIFDEPADTMMLYTDEAKVSQILRNFISNAIKFTEAGEIRISAVRLPDTDAVRFSVADTGLGIAPEHQQIIFEEFGQVENRLQHRVKGTGLGLPLCRKLADLLGGRVELESELGKGSVFSAVIPVTLRQEDAATAFSAAVPEPVADERLPVLVIEDNQQTRMLYEKYLRGTNFRPIPVRSLWEAEEVWTTLAPAAIVLDLNLNGEDTWRWLMETKSNELRKATPVIVATEIDDRAKGLSLGADAYFVKPVLRDELLAELVRLTMHAAAPLSGRISSGTHSYET